MVLLLTSLLGGCASASSSSQTSAPTKPTTHQDATPPTVVLNPDAVVSGSIYPEAQLLGVAESREEAESLAELYGITLVNFNYRFASFYTEEDPYEVIRRGEENGWPPLSLNRTLNLY